jgi:hypothetical protein
MKSLMQNVLLSILWVCLTASIGYATCTPQIGYGTNKQCQQGDSCGEICGVTSAWCITETCTQSLSCFEAGYIAQDIECITGGCLNPAQGNCTTCP